MSCPPTLRAVFSALKSTEISDKISEFSESDVRPVLSCLVRLAVLPSTTVSEVESERNEQKQRLLKTILSYPSAAGLIQLMHDTHFEQLEAELKDEEIIDNQTDPFEQCDATAKFLLIISKLLRIDLDSQNLSRLEALENTVYHQQIIDILSIALSELPQLLSAVQICDRLMHFNNGSLIALGIVANCPDQYMSVIDSLIDLGVKFGENSLLAKEIDRAICLLVDLQPSVAQEIISKLCALQKLPGLLLTLASDFCLSHTFVSTLTGILLSGNNWVNQFMVTSQKKSASPVVAKIKSRLLSIAADLTPPEGQTISPENVLPAANFIRLLCILKTFGSLRILPHEARVYLALICSRAPVCPQSPRLINTAIATVLACPTLIHAQQQAEMEAETKLIEWVRWLLRVENDFEQVHEKDSGYGELLLLVAFQFHADQLNQIAQLVSTVLGFKVTIQNKLLTRLKFIFTVDLMNEQAVAERAARLAVTNGLSAKSQGYLPIHCVLQLLKSRSFLKYKVSISGWIIEQMSKCETPIHSSVPELIEAYVRSCLVPLTKASAALRERGGAQSLANQPLEEEKLMKFFLGNPLDESYTVMRCLCAYYILYYDSIVEHESRKLAMNNRKPYWYSDRIWSAVPFRYLAAVIAQQEGSYAALHAPFMKLLASQCPYLLSSSKVHLAKRAVNGISPEQFTLAVQSMADAPSQAMILLRALKQQPPRVIVEYMRSLMETIKTALNHKLPNVLLEEISEVWSEIEALVPRALYEKTVSVLNAKHNIAAIIGHKDLCNDPLVILRCDQRIFRCPSLLPLLLRMLTFYLSASAQHLRRQVNSSPVPQDDEVQKERQGLLNALIGAQESAVVQMLLEVCLCTPADNKQSQISVLRHCRALICSHIHQMFINEPALSKLVHFQGYPTELIPVTVSGIPSMHICLDFIPELLSQADMDKRAFAIELLAHLAQQFATVRAFNRAKLCIDVLSTLLENLPFENTQQLFQAVCPSLASIGTVFPPLMTDVVSLMSQVECMCSARLAQKAQATASAAGFGDKRCPEQELLVTMQDTFHNKVLKICD